MTQPSSTQIDRPALLDLEDVSIFLGQPISSVRRWIHKPPAGFPPLVFLGRKICIKAAQLEAWANGEFDFVPVEIPEEIHSVKTEKSKLQVGKRGRGRPRKLSQPAQSQV